MALKTIFYSVLNNKCPNCHEGDVFIGKSAYDFKTFDKLHETCEHCGHKYEKEPGFFYGAMYVSYALMVAWFVITWSLNGLIFHIDSIYYLVFLVISIIVLMPVTFRQSRLIWINFFTKYQEHGVIEHPKKKTENTDELEKN